MVQKNEIKGPTLLLMVLVQRMDTIRIAEQLTMIH
jgi:hypothetical protein